MKSLYTLGAAAGFVALAAGFSIPTAVSAAPASPIAIKQSRVVARLARRERTD
jgi:hypothetical protein